MHACILRHVPFEGPAAILDIIRGRGWTASEVHLYRGDPCPTPDDYDALISMGGPMSVYDVSDYPWLLDERRMIGAAADASKPVVGVCLGAQQIAAALGGSVVASPSREIGWFPLEWEAEAGGGEAPAPVAFHWHGEMAQPPSGAVVIARSQGCPVQAFRIGAQILGLQLHLEMDSDAIEAILAGSGDEIRAHAGERWVADEPSIRAGVDTYGRSAIATLGHLLASVGLD